LTNKSRTGIINIENEREVKVMNKKTDFETMLEIFKRSNVNIICEQENYIEIEPVTCGENIGFNFDSQGNFKELI
jgi:hypothetical protein